MYNSGNSSKNVTGASIVDGTVETVDIADDAVTADKLANSVNTDIATGVSGSTTANAALPKAGGTMTGNIKFTGNTTISHDTVDGSDTGVITIAGGGADGHTRGSSISVSGNESGNIGLLLLRTTNQIRNNTGGIERLRIDSTNVTVQTGNLKIATAGKGIDFGTGLGANLLDDYEEGTWTPSIADASSGGNENALGGTFNYTKIGNTVHLWGLASNFSTAGLTAGNDVYVTGLPFTSGSETPCSIWWQNMNINNTGMIVPRILNGYSVIRFDEMVDNTNAEAMIVSDFASGTVDFRIQATYKV